jgi:hypothetical protein
MSKEQFENLVDDLLQRVREPVVRCLQKVHGACTNAVPVVQIVFAHTVVPAQGRNTHYE